MKKHAFSLLKALTQNWLIADGVGEKLLAQLPDLLNAENLASKTDDEDEIEEKPYAYAIHGNAQTGFFSYESFDKAPKNSIAIVEVKGVIMKESTCWDAGTSELKKQTEMAAQHPNIGALLYLIDSGGGSVAGTEVFANAIKEVSERYQKPTLAFVEDMAASAAYWIASSANEIWASGETTEIGSIGVAATITDRREALAKAGYKQHYIRATDSTSKNEDYLQALDGKPERIIKNSLDPINAIFHSTVKANRPNLVIEEKSKAPLDGSMYMASAALDQGLIDGICTMPQAIERLQSKITNATSSPNSKNMFGTNNKFKNVVALASKTGKEISDEMLAKANEELQTAGINAVGLVTEEFVETAEANASKVADLQKKLDTATSDASTKASRITDLEAEVAQLKKDNKSAGAEHSKPPKETAEGDGKGAATEQYIDPNASHNKMLAKMRGEA